jgi:iduronate 2-sulfatase
MPQHFKENGYWTAGAGKVFHNTTLDPGSLAWNESVRFENDELPIVTAEREKFEAVHGSIEQAGNRRPWINRMKEVSAKLNAQTPPGFGRSGLDDSQHKDGKNVQQVVDWVKERRFGEKPFFIACGLQKPHVPFLAPSKYFDLHPSGEIDFFRDRSNLWDSIPAQALSKRYEAFGFELGVENVARRQQYMQAYHACVSFIDAQLQRVFEVLKQEGLWDETIIVFTSDHGYHLGDHFLWGKVTLFDIGAKVPLLIRAPGLTASGGSSEAMVELVDLFPTLTDLTGLKNPDSLQGVSLRPLLGHPERLGKKRLAYSVVRRGPNLGYAIRDQRWRYTRWPDGEELYHLPNDPGERNNLVGKPHVAERLSEYRLKLDAKRASVMELDNPAERQ